MFKLFRYVNCKMSSQHYRDRLATLEKELYEVPSSSISLLFSTYYVYVLIVTAWFLLLVVFTPSFLYTSKKKNQVQQKQWEYIILGWIILSVGTGFGYHNWNK